MQAFGIVAILGAVIALIVVATKYGFTADDLITILRLIKQIANGR